MSPRSKAHRHVPVLLAETVAALQPQPGDVVVDCTVGLGGHATALLRAVQPGGRLLGLDLDPASLDVARRALEATGGAFTLNHTNFAALPTVLAEAGLAAADVVVADLGVSSPQLDDPARGFAFRLDGPLDMRMDSTRGQTAASLLAKIPERTLADALRDLGDEEDADAIAREVVAERARAPIDTTRRLMEIVCRARDFTLRRAAGAKLHPATRTFQVLRMLVNRELPNLERLLAILPDVVAPGGRVAILTFHSGEDRRVKAALRDGRRGGLWSAISPDPVRASPEEIAANPRSRSAKLRWAIRAPAVATGPRGSR